MPHHCWKSRELLGIHTYAFHHTDFPDDLKQTGDDCPPLIHLLGNKALLGREAVAIVGARAADKRGREAAYKWGAAYARQGKIVISGLALGCVQRPIKAASRLKGNPRR